MKIAILSDIHANLAAFEAVLRDIDKKGGVDQYWNLGDITDYGPDPHECLQKVRQLEAVSIIGNHDYAVIGKLDYMSEFPPSIAFITSWTSRQMTPEDLIYLQSLPATLVIGKFTLVHASPRDPIWEYVFSEDLARENLSHFQTKYCLLGHTHVPAYFEFKDGSEPVKSDKEYRVIRSHDWIESLRKSRRGEIKISLTNDRFIVNPGGIGQPRDGEPRAAYALYNSDDATIELRRVEYNMSLTQKRMQAAGLPESFSARLAEGR